MKNISQSNKKRISLPLYSTIEQACLNRMIFFIILKFFTAVF